MSRLRLEKPEFRRQGGICAKQREIFVQSKQDYLMWCSPDEWFDALVTCGPYYYSCLKLSFTDYGVTRQDMARLCLILNNTCAWLTATAMETATSYDLMLEFNEFAMPEGVTSRAVCDEIWDFLEDKFAIDDENFSHN